MVSTWNNVLLFMMLMRCKTFSLSDELIQVNVSCDLRSAPPRTPSLARFRRLRSPS